MRNAHPREIRYFQTRNGREPFSVWLKETIQDRTTRARVRRRLTRLRAGNFGDCNPIGEGIFELRLDFGAGYRIYFGEVGTTVVLLLCAGDKSSQGRDIARAKTYWREYREAH